MIKMRTLARVAAVVLGLAAAVTPAAVALAGGPPTQSDRAVIIVISPIT